MTRRTLLLLGLVLVPGCGVVLEFLDLLTDGGPAVVETDSPELKRFTSEQELVDFFVDQISARNSRFAATAPSPGIFEDFGDDLGAVSAEEPLATPGDGVAPIPQADSPTAGADSTAQDTDSTAAGDESFSETTLQEEGVDEADVVKTDGTYIYIIDHGTLEIVRATPPEQLALLSEVELEGSGREIYLHDGKVIALTASGGGFFFGGGGIAILEQTIGSDAGSDVTGVREPDFGDEFTFQRPRTIVTVIDVSTPEAPTVLSTTTFDGTQTSSRLIDGVLHLVLANFQDFFFDVLPALGSPELDLTAVDAETFLPKFERTDGDPEAPSSTGSVVTFKDMFRPTDPDGFGVVTVVSIDIDAGAAFTGVGVVAEPGLVYSSPDALYLTDTEFTFTNQVRETTDIYKFAYQDRGVVASATGSVPGRVLNQFSMGEHQGHLRVATTVGPTFTLGGRTESANNVYVLNQTGDQLAIVGRIEDIAPGETIRSARFLGDRGYLVTFEQIDPFFTLDLSDPMNPVVVGELKVAGFSTLILPMDANHLLTVGRFVPEEAPFFPQGVQLSIFDVTDFANPQRTANVILGAEAGAFSEALFDHKAFTYFRAQGLVALPVTIQTNGGFFDVIFAEEEDSGEVVDPQVDAEPPLDEPVVIIEPVIPLGFEGLVVFSATPEAGLSELGRISTRVEEAGFSFTSFTRGVFIGENVFAVTNNAVRSAPVADLSSIAHELLLTSTQP